MSGGETIIVVSDALEAALAAIVADVQTVLRINETFEFPLSRQRIYNLLDVLHDGDDHATKLTDADAFLEGQEVARLHAYCVSHIDPRINIIEFTKTLIQSLSRKYDTSVGVSILSEIVGTPYRAARIRTTNSVPRAKRVLHLLRTYRKLVERATGAEAGHVSQISVEGDAATDPDCTGTAIPAPIDRYAGRARLQHEVVDMDQLMQYIFPENTFHVKSTGRLIVFALYGPFTTTGGICGGKGVGRDLSEREINNMIASLEREDVLEIFAGGSVLCDTHGVEVETHAASRSLPQMTRAQIESILIDLPRDVLGRCTFHDIQQRVLQARRQRIEDGKRMFPSVTHSKADIEAVRTRIRDPDVTFGRGTISQRLGARALAATMLTTTPQSASTQTLSRTVINLAATGSLRPGTTGVRSSTTAAATHKQKKRSSSCVARKLDATAMTRLTDHMLHQSSSLVVSIDDLHHPDTAPRIVSSLKIARLPHTKHSEVGVAAVSASIPKPVFDVNAAFRHAPSRGTIIH